jgi:putative ABC transport system permease protein
MPDLSTCRQADWRAEIRRRLAPHGLRPTREMEIVEEIGQHLDDRCTRLRSLGASDDEAIAGAWRELDEADVLGRAVSRVESPAPLTLPPLGAAPSGGWLGTLWQDIRYSARTLRSAPAFSVTVLLAVALSIGPVTAILSVGNWLLWRPHPGVTDARSLGVVWFGQWRQSGAGVGVSPSGVSYDNLADIRSRGRSITGIAGVQESSSSLSVPGGLPRQAGTAVVTADFFEVLGVRLSAGRSFTTDEDRPPFGSPVVVISHGLAQSAFGSAGAALGKTVALNSQPFSIIGVAPPAFGGISNTGGIEAWLTGATWPYVNHVKEPRAMSRQDGIFYEFVVRAAPDTTFAEVESELKVLARQLADVYPTENTKFLGVAPRVFPGLGLPPLMRAGTRRMVNTMLATGCVLLLLGCANVANLLMFRAARRAHEIAIRKALGASRSRLMQLQMMESWLLSAAGTILGLALAVYLKQLLDQLLFPRPPGMSFTVPMDTRMLGFTAAVALATGTLTALAPGWLMTRTRGLAALGRATVTWSRAPKLRGGLAVLQLALSLTLLVGALLLVSTLRNLRGVDLGFDPDRVSVVSFNLDEHGYDSGRALAYHRQVLPALQAIGEFETVSLSYRAPFGAGSSVRVIPPGGDQKTAMSVLANGVSDSYFRALSIPIVRGRAFTSDETLFAGDTGPLIVNETLALRLFRTVDVVGRTVRFPATGVNPEQKLVIVGVARDSRWRSIAREPESFLYQPFAQFRSRGTSGVYMIKSGLPALRVGEIANSIAARTASAIPLSVPRPLTTGIDRELSEQRVFAWMLSLLAALGFALAALGLYGLVAQATIERRREFGIRLALGARGANIVRLVAGHAAIVSSLGVAIGLGLSYFGTRVIQSMLFGVSRLDPAVYVAAVATLTLVVALACVGPARRALRVQAVEVLRAE